MAFIGTSDYSKFTFLDKVNAGICANYGGYYGHNSGHYFNLGYNNNDSDRIKRFYS